MKIFTTYLVAAGLLLSAGTIAQTTEKGEKGEKGEKKEIIIEKKEGDKKEKMVIVIDGNNVTINGKPAEDFKGTERIVIDDDIVINGNVVRVPGHPRNVTITTNSNRPLLGVTTDKTEGGVKINSVTKGSGAEKAGLKAGDILTAINKTVINSPEQLVEAIGKQKVGDMVDVTYKRAGKVQKVKATLGKNAETYTVNNDFDYNFKFDSEQGEPFAFSMPRMPEWNNNQFRKMMIYGSDKPKYGMSIEDDEEMRGVKVTDVDDEGNAYKGGLKEDDIITEVNGEKVKNVDELKEKLDAQKEQLSVTLKVLRAGKTESLTIKVPRKLKSANL